MNTVLTAGYSWLLWMDVWVNLRFCTRFRPDLLYLLLCFPVFVTFTLLSIKEECYGHSSYTVEIFYSGHGILEVHFKTI